MYKLQVYSDELYHYGVKGMKWGVRRYQNYDGTRIGTGGAPVQNLSKQAGSADRGTVVNGYRGKSRGPARLAAAAGGAMKAESADSGDGSDNKAKSTAEKVMGPSVKKGKGRDDTSVAQEASKHVLELNRDAQEIIKNAKESDPKVQEQRAKQEKSQRQKAKQMSDKELRDSINRIKMEREYVSLTTKETETGYDKALEIVKKAEPWLKVATEVAGLVLLLYKIKNMKQSDDDLEGVYAYCIDNGFDSDIIQHATDLDLDYICDYYSISDEDLQHILDHEDELYHHGVKGMKWGVRRYQNYDGTRIGTGGGGGGGTATRSAGPSKKRSLKDYAYVEAYRDKNNKVGLRFTSDGPKPFKIPPKKTVASGGGPKLAAKSPNSSTSKSVGDALKDTMNEQKELGKAVKDAITRPLDERRANADAAHKKAINAVKSGLDKAVKDGHVEASSNLLTSYKQKRLVKEAQKMPSNIPQIAKKSHLVSEKTLRDLGNKRRVLDDAIIDGSDDLIKVDNYDIAYTRRSLKWSEKDLKENHPDQYKQIVRDAKAGNYDPIEHKLVERNSAAYKEIEKYSPPETEKTRAIYKAHKDYHNACKKATQDLVGDYGKEIITSNDGGWKSKDVEYLVSAWLEGSAMDRSDQIYRARNR